MRRITEVQPFGCEQASVPSCTTEGGAEIRVLSARDMRALEEATWEAGLPQAALMEQAIQKMASWIRASFPPTTFPRIAAFCGKSGNGADGFGVLRHLQLTGYNCTALCEGSLSTKPSHALNAEQRTYAEKVGVRILPFSQAGELSPSILLDALVGFGFKGTLADSLADHLEILKNLQLDSHAPLIAVDLPSGLAADGCDFSWEGACPPRCHHTLCLAHLKPALCDDRSLPYTGQVHVLGLDTLPHAPVLQRSQALLVVPRSFPTPPQALPPDGPERALHKYSKGHALIWGGSDEYAGALDLAVKGAWSALPGYVTVYSDSSLAKQLCLIHRPRSVVRSSTALLSLDTRISREKEPRPQAFLIGPGLDAETLKHPEKLDSAVRLQCRLVIDATALQPSTLQKLLKIPPALPRDDASVSPIEHAGERVLTPHQGEFDCIWNAFLVPKNGTPQRFSRIDRAAHMAKHLRVHVVLKGGITLHADPNGSVRVFHRAHPALATAGNGDIFAGYLTSLMAQGQEVRQAVENAIEALHHHLHHLDLRSPEALQLGAQALDINGNTV